MSRYERRVWFDRLCELRDAHRSLGTDDTMAVMSISEALDWATGRLGEPADADAATTPAGDPADRPA